MPSSVRSRCWLTPRAVLAGLTYGSVRLGWRFADPAPDHPCSLLVYPYGVYQ
jgi:hypothetical protein